ncbi:class I SAM-dependent RNA methyltransferase [Actibacterium sp. MT2.3-13A]|uniref:class I SAM-dependent RNA methyltransferase n=1 Tax=Actibacterium sp. MT2.3-13A TaxID=2828332 RepID=UPI001BAC2200|nr:class I SAM-dependent RNA methyltransferase [Actibacterium sp. MT2.3-13A]
MKVTIERLGHRGDGVGPGPVYVPLTLPGEEVEIDEASGAVRIATPSADRVRPPCPHFKSCGGCALQHASDAFVADWKVAVVRAALAAQGLEAEMRPIATSPARSRRRATLAGKRTKKGVIVGSHARASDTVVPVPECRLLHPGLMACLPALEEITSLGASRKGALDLALTLSEAGVDVAVTGAKPMDAALFAALGALAGAHDLARLSWNGELLAERRAPVQRMGRALVSPPPGAFLQATAEGEGALVGAVREAAGGAKRMADLFAGCGTFALPLAEQAEIHAVEGEAALLAALDQGWRRAEGLRRVTTETRDLFRRPLMPDELSRYDALVIDPPRAGAEAQVAQIAASNVPVVAMVSCNPVTFARDARALVQAGFALDWVQVVDQFRWSPHVELAARFGRP